MDYYPHQFHSITLDALKEKMASRAVAKKLYEKVAFITNSDNASWERFSRRWVFKDKQWRISRSPSSDKFDSLICIKYLGNIVLEAMIRLDVTEYYRYNIEIYIPGEWEEELEILSQRIQLEEEEARQKKYALAKNKWEIFIKSEVSRRFGVEIDEVK